MGFWFDLLFKVAEVNVQNGTSCLLFWWAFGIVIFMTNYIDSVILRSIINLGITCMVSKMNRSIPECSALARSLNYFCVLSNHVAAKRYVLWNRVTKKIFHPSLKFAFLRQGQIGSIGARWRLIQNNKGFVGIIWKSTTNVWGLILCPSLQLAP
jgi:hypothetical protein